MEVGIKMVKIPYGADLYKPLSELVNYVRKKYNDITEVFRNTMQPTSGLELALAGVPNNLMVSQYAPPSRYGIYGKILLANTNGNSSNTTSIKRIWWEGPYKLRIISENGIRAEFKHNAAKKSGDFSGYVAGILEAIGINLTTKDINIIVEKLRNPH